MLVTFNRLLKLAVIFSAVITGWTAIVLFTNSKFNVEIEELVTQMYFNQKNLVFNVKDLSLLLVKDANERFSAKDQNPIRLNGLKTDF